MVSLLTAAGPNGLSPNQLAEEIYNEPASGLAGSRIVQIVARLRKKGYQIISTGNGAGAGVYILREN